MFLEAVTVLNRPYPHTRYWTRTSLQWRILTRKIIKKEINFISIWKQPHYPSNKYGLLRRHIHPNITLTVMSPHQTGPRCRWIPHKKRNTRFQAAIFLLSFSAPHNSLGWVWTITTLTIHQPWLCLILLTSWPLGVDKCLT